MSWRQLSIPGCHFTLSPKAAIVGLARQFVELTRQILRFRNSHGREIDYIGDWQQRTASVAANGVDLQAALRRAAPLL